MPATLSNRAFSPLLVVACMFALACDGDDAASDDPAAEAGSDGEAPAGDDDDDGSEDDDDGGSDGSDSDENPWGLHAGVVIDLGYQYDVLSGEWEYEYAKWMLFDDGSVYFGLPRSHLDDFDTGASRLEDPGKWGEWDLAGDVLRTLRDGEWRENESWFELTVPSQDHRLSGAYVNLETLSSSTGETTFFATGWSVVVFAEDGRFEGNAGGSVTTDPGVVGATTDTAGRYAINGAEIVFEFDDGTVVRNSLLMSSAAENTLFINGVQFVADS